MAEYQFKPHEQPMIDGSPAVPDHPFNRRVIYFLIGILVATYGGLQNGLLLANLPLVQAARALTPEEGGWVKAAYYIPYACMSMMLFRVRQQLGIQFFVRLALWALLTANVVQLFVEDYWAEVASRAISAIAGAGMISLSIYYFMQSMPPKHRMVGIFLGIGLYQLGLPLARAISPALLTSGDITTLYVFQFGLTLIIVGAVSMFTLPPGRTIHVFRKLDFVSFPLLAGGLGLLFAFLIQGMIIWWDHAWLGWVLALALMMVGTALLIEYHRPYPMLELRWLATRDVALVALSGALVRIALSEQNFGATGFLTMVGMAPDQTVVYNWILVAATVAGVIVSAIRLDLMDFRQPVVITFGLIAVASFVDMHSSSLSRPQDFYLTQTVVAFAAVYFMGSVQLEGMLRAMVRGPTYIVSFVAVFSLGQTLGAYVGSALLYTFQTMRAKAHLIDIAQRLSLSDPTVAREVSAIAASGAPFETDQMLRQAEGVSILVKKALIEAQVQSYNDGFFLAGCISSAIFVITLSAWLYNRYHGIIPHGEALRQLQEGMARRR